MKTILGCPHKGCQSAVSASSVEVASRSLVAHWSRLHRTSTGINLQYVKDRIDYLEKLGQARANAPDTKWIQTTEATKTAKAMKAAKPAKTIQKLVKLTRLQRDLKRWKLMGRKDAGGIAGWVSALAEYPTPDNAAFLKHVPARDLPTLTELREELALRELHDRNGADRSSPYPHAVESSTYDYSTAASYPPPGEIQLRGCPQCLTPTIPGNNFCGKCGCNLVAVVEGIIIASTPKARAAALPFIK